MNLSSPVCCDVIKVYEIDLLPEIRCWFCCCCCWRIESLQYFVWFFRNYWKKNYIDQIFAVTLYYFVVSVLFVSQVLTSLPSLPSLILHHRDRCMIFLLSSLSLSLSSLSQVGDELLEINGNTTEGMLHSDAITIIKHGGNSVKLTIRRILDEQFIGCKWVGSWDEMGVIMR